MSNIGITTITIMVDNENAYNYGNKLQMFALQEYLREHGHYCETIRYKASMPLISENSKREKKYSNITQVLDDAIRILKRTLLKKAITKKSNERKKKFDSFVENNIVLSQICYSKDSDLSELGEKYDFLITGSDQVWNPYCEGTNEFYYLTFAPSEKRIAYAPSIAVNHIPDELKMSYNKWISGINHLSIREDVGQKLLADQFGFDAKLVCDPVFLIDKSQWSSLAMDFSKEPDYFVTYFLGKKTVETKKKIKKLERISGYRCIDIYTRDYAASRFAGPEEFLGLIRNAKFVCTDSFHGTAFSIIFEVPVVVFERNSENKMNSRIESLLRVASIDNRTVDEVINNSETLQKVVFDKEGNLHRLIKESKVFLDIALN